MKQHKNILLVIFTAAALLQFTACKKQLEEVTPQDAISKDLFLTPTLLKHCIMGLIHCSEVLTALFISWVK